MREIRSRKKIVDNISIQTWETKAESCNVLEVEVGTTGFCGGGSGHGSRTYLRIQDKAGSDIRVNILRAENSLPCGFELVMCGDCELITLIDALSFALETLKSESGG